MLTWVSIVAATGVLGGAVDDAQQIFKDAVAAWHMNDGADATTPSSTLRPVGDGAIFGQSLDDAAASRVHGGDGKGILLRDSALDAGQGASGELNISGSAVTALIRLKRTGGTWDVTLLSKHGGHEALQYNLYAFQRFGGRFEIGAEVGTSSGMGKATTIMPASGSDKWHDVVLRYDGRTVDLFVDGGRRASTPHTGALRATNESPLLIGGERQGEGVGRRFTGLVDHAAVWGRALSDEEIRVLNAGEAAAAIETRPMLHFTPLKNWMNDPNGLIWHDGEYHLFYQHNPFGDQWGHMSWGHAVSRDGFVWKHLPVAIPEANGVMAFSGTAVFDRDNTSGFGTKANPPLVAIYTGHEERRRRQHQDLAYSLDRGRTWTTYSGNPVIDLEMEHFRDPKVFWHAPTSRWIMVVFLANDRTAHFYASNDLKQWTLLSTFAGHGRPDIPNWECPDLFELPVDGDSTNTRWVMVISVGGNGPYGGSGVQYFVGRFDGEKFVNENPPEMVLWMDHGRDFYAFQSFQDEPNGKRVGLAWMVNLEYAGSTPTSPWRGAMTLPREYRLTRTPEGIRLAQLPMAGAAETLRSKGAKETRLTDRDISAGISPSGISASVGIFEAEFEIGSADRFGMRVRDGGEEYTTIGYDVRLREMYVDRRKSGNTTIHPRFAGHHAAALPIGADNRVKLTIVLDRCSVEVFGNDGRASITSLIFPEVGVEGVSFFAENGSVKLRELRATAIAEE